MGTPHASVQYHHQSYQILLTPAQTLYTQLPLQKLQLQLQLSRFTWHQDSIHDTFNQRNRWEPHAIEGWCIRPSIKHYHCHKCYIL